MSDTKEEKKLVNKQIIIGPYKLTELVSNKYNKHIYLFYDEHVDKVTCSEDKDNYPKIEIQDYIEQIINSNKDKVIDIFLETSIGEGIEVRFEKSYLNYINEKYSPCYQSDRRNCPYLNSRFHYVDMRSFPKDVSFFSLQLKLIEELLEGLRNIISIRKQYKEKTYSVAKDLGYNLDDFIDNEKLKTSLEQVKIFYNQEYNKFTPKNPYVTDAFNDEQVKNYLQIIKKFSWVKQDKEEKEINFSFDLLLGNNKILKQIGSIKDVSITQKLFQFMELKFIEYTPDFEGLTSILQLYENNLNFDIFDFISDFVKELRSVNTLVMDSYLLARLFKKFTQKDKEYSEDSKYIIIYAGGTHSGHYEEFLKDYLNFKIIQESTSDKEGINYQCLDISKFDQPFFKYNREPISHVI